MKTNKLLLTMVLIITALLFIPNTVNAADGDTFTISTPEADFNYTIISEESATVELTSYASLYQGETSAAITSTVENNLKTYTVTTIGDRAFSNCHWLQEVTIPNTVTDIEEFAFEYCLNLANVSELTNVTTIGASAFEGCSTLASVLMPNVKTIGNRAFAYGSVLTGITIPVGVTTIEPAVFAGCPELKSIVIPEGVTSIGKDAFSYCINLENVILPSTITEIEDGAFSSCTSLTSILLPEGLKTIGTDYGNGIYGTGVFAESGLTSIVIPNSVEKINGYAFAHCANLEKVTIPNPKTELEYFYAFENCPNLVEVVAYPGSPAGKGAIENNILCTPIYNVQKNLTNLVAKNEMKNTNYEVILVPSEGYNLPEDIVVTIGGTKLSQKVDEWGEGYFYENTTGYLSIDYWNIKDDIVIEAQAVQAYKIEIDTTEANLEYFYINENDAAQTESLMINKGNSLFFRINAMPDYLIDEISFDGKFGTIKPGNQYFEFGIIPESDMKIKITTKSNIATYDLIIGTAEGLTVTPTGTMQVTAGGNKEITIKEQDGYRLESVYAIVEYNDSTEPAEQWVPLNYDYDNGYITATVELVNQSNIKNITLNMQSKKGIKSAKELQMALGGEKYAKVEGNVVTLLKDITLDEKSLWIIGGDNTLDLNGHKIVIADEFSDWAMFEIDKQAKFTINDSSNGNGTMDAKDRATVIAIGESLLTINGGTFIASEAVSVYENSNMVINNGKFIGEFAALTLYEETNVTVNNGTFISENGYAIYYMGMNELLINAGEFVGNTSAVLISVFDAENINIELKGGEFKRRCLCNRGIFL